jgi:hypothetical protein
MSIVSVTAKSRHLCKGKFPLWCSDLECQQAEVHIVATQRTTFITIQTTLIISFQPNP